VSPVRKQRRRYEVDDFHEELRNIESPSFNSDDKKDEDAEA
jgi:hypothetical protein